MALAAPANAAPGDLDPSFSADGIQTTDFAGQFDSVRSVAVQPDGKIVAAGRAGNTPDFAVARYNPDGSLDSGFSGDGKQTTDFGGFDEAFGMVLQADGKIILVGDGPAVTPSIGNSIDFALARYNSDGSLDPTFSGDGKLLTNAGGDDGAKAVAVQPGGKIVVVGLRNLNDTIGGPQILDWALAQYNSDGSLDTTFSGDGLETTDFGGDDGAAGVALQTDGKIVVSGVAANDFGLARYNPDGSLDTSFSSDGKQLTDFGDSDFANDIAIQADGKIVAAGGSKNGASSQFALARYSTDGTLDATFAGDGRQTTNFAGDIDVASGVVIDASGKIVAAGGLEDNTGGEGPPFDFALARYNSDGSLDTGFSGDGMQTTDLGGFETARGGVALQPDGNIVVAGSNNDFVIARYAGGSTTPPADSDGDGVPDTADACPSVAANTANGCPAPPPDSDGDGLADTADACPSVAASTANGCPAPPPVTPRPPPPPVDTTAPVAALTGSAQKLGKTVAVTIACADEACNAKTSASVRVPAVGSAKAKTYKLTAVRTTIAKGKSIKVKLTLPTAARAAIKRALRAHKRIVVAVTLTVTDAAGNKRTLHRQIRLKA